MKHIVWSTLCCIVFFVSTTHASLQELEKNLIALKEKLTELEGFFPPVLPVDDGTFLYRFLGISSDASDSEISTAIDEKFEVFNPKYTPFLDESTRKQLKANRNEILSLLLKEAEAAGPLRITDVSGNLIDGVRLAASTLTNQRAPYDAGTYRPNLDDSSILFQNILHRYLRNARLLYALEWDVYQAARAPIVNSISQINTILSSIRDNIKPDLLDAQATVKKYTDRIQTHIYQFINPRYPERDPKNPFQEIIERSNAIYKKEFSILKSILNGRKIFITTEAPEKIKSAQAISDPKLKATKLAGLSQELARDEQVLNTFAKIIPLFPQNEQTQLYRVLEPRYKPGSPNPINRLRKRLEPLKKQIGQ